MILCVAVAEPFSWGIVFKKGTHVGDLFGAVLIWLEGRFSGEESARLKDLSSSESTIDLLGATYETSEHSDISSGANTMPPAAEYLEQINSLHQVPV